MGNKAPWIKLTSALDIILAKLLFEQGVEFAKDTGLNPDKICLRVKKIEEMEAYSIRYKNHWYSKGELVAHTLSRRDAYSGLTVFNSKFKPFAQEVARQYEGLTGKVLKIE